MTASTTDDSSRFIRVIDARTHNLKHVSVEIPHNKLVVITGRSGSGKSSLAIDTIFAEGQRQYFESLSLHSRQFIKQLPRADVERIEGLQAAICLDQNNKTGGRRSTVGTVTEVYDFLRLLMSRIGEIHCFQCGREINHQTPRQIVNRLVELPERTKVMVLSPVTAGKDVDCNEVLKKIRRERLVRVRVDGEIHDIDRLPPIHPTTSYVIEAITDRIIIREGVEKRLFEAVEFADRLSTGTVTIAYLVPESKTWHEFSFSTRYACPDCDIQYSEVQPRTFSFNSPQGACPACHGIGLKAVDFDSNLVIPNRDLVIEEAVVPWLSLTASKKRKMILQLDGVLQRIQWSPEQALSEMTESQWEYFWSSREKTCLGLEAILSKEFATTSDDDRLGELEQFQAEVVCDQCNGSRLNETARSIFLAGKHMGQIVDMPISTVSQFLQDLNLGSERSLIAEPIVTQIQKRLRFLIHVGVGYLTLGRSAITLSGGEHQRVRLATSVGSGLSNVCYILDEPSIGLHQRDNERLNETIRQLQTAGNSVILIEHDESTIRNADYLIDVGPGAGSMGGSIVAAGTPDDVCATKSLTGEFLTGQKTIVSSKPELRGDNRKSIEIRGCSGRNLKSIDVEFPLGRLVCVTGVSGSGKSTLINQTLVPAIRQRLDRATIQPQPFEEVRGVHHLSNLIAVDQKPIGKSPRGCPATVIGIFDHIRKIYASTKQAKQLGYGISRFSFNSKSGWCPGCRGLGSEKVEMSVMPDFYVVCEQCLGRRFNLQTLKVQFKNRSIADVLSMTVDEAIHFFDGFEKIKRPLECLAELSMGYLQLGQSTTTISGGESQRLKLAAEIAKPTAGHTLYVLDEPTTGLHFADVQALLDAMNRIVDQGNSMIVIEHNLDIVRCSDWVIDLGPEGGQAGGQIVVTGTPNEIAAREESHTGRFLKRTFAK